MNDLPTEVLDRILHCLDKRNLKTCYLVCKSWHSLIVPLLWREITISNDGIFFLKQQLKEKNFNDYFRYGHVVKKLTLFDYHYSRANKTRLDVDFTKEEFLTILATLNNLTEIYIRRNDQMGSYLTYLLDANLTKISKIQVDSDYHHNAYFSVCYKFRTSISYLDLSYNKNTKELDNVVSLLPDFQCLDTLLFHNSANNNMNPLQLLNICHKLKNFTFTSDYPFSSDINTETTQLNSFKQLSSFKLELPSLTTNYTQYLISHFPNQLANFKLHILKQNLFDWIDNVKMNTSLELLDKISKYEGISICFQSPEDIEVNNEAKLSKLFQIFHSLRRNKKLYLDISAEGMHSSNSSTWQFQNGSDGYINIIHKIYEDEFDPETSFLKFPDNDTLSSGLDMLSKLNIDLFRHDDEDAFYEVLVYCLNYFSNLEEFTLTRCYTDEYNSFNDDFISTVHYATTKNYITSNDIDLLKISFVSDTQTYLELLNDSFPYIERLVLEYSDIDDIEIDLTNFKNLKYLTYRGDFISEDKVVLFTFTNEESQYFCYDKNRDQLIWTNETENLEPNLTVVCDKSVAINFLHFDDEIEFIHE